MGPKVDPSRGHEHSALSLRAKDGTFLRFGPALDFNLASVGAEELTHALAEYKEAVKLKPSNPYFRVEYGNATVLQGDIKGALAEYREASRLAGKIFRTPLPGNYLS